MREKSRWNRVQGSVCTVAAAAWAVPTANGTSRIFTYTYEPETMPKGAKEFEQWITARIGRARATGKENYVRWDIREEFELGVTDWYTAALYLNLKHESYRDGNTGSDVADFEFQGVSLENRFLLLNPVGHPVGLTFYVEPGFGGEEAEIETKLILGQRHGPWKWAVNFLFEHEWEHHYDEVVAHMGVSAGLSYDLGNGWFLGLECWNDHKLEEYSEWKNSVLYLGPVVSYRAEDWWATLTVLPQVWGRNHDGDPDGESGFDLSSNERVQVRVLFGIDF